MPCSSRVVSLFCAGTAVLFVAGGCRSQPDARDVAEVAAAAGHYVVGDTTGARPDSPRVWNVEVVRGVRDSAEVERHLTELLGARPRRPTDFTVEYIAIDSVGLTRRGLALEIGLSTRRRCGPTWGTTVAWSGTYGVRAHRVATRWMLDSVNLRIDGFPTFCQDSLGRLVPP